MTNLAANLFLKNQGKRLAARVYSIGEQDKIAFMGL